MYKFKQDLAMAYFDGCSKKTASRLLAREINLINGILDKILIELRVAGRIQKNSRGLYDPEIDGDTPPDDEA